MTLSSSGFCFVVGIGADGGHFAVGLRHELLEHIVERFLLRRGRLLPVRLRLTLLEAAARALGLLPRGRRLRLMERLIFPPSSPMTMTLTVWPSVRYSCRSLT